MGRCFKIAMAGFSLALAAGCGGGGDGSIAPTSIGTVAASSIIAAHNPANNEEGVTKETPISVTFTEAMDRESFTKDTFIVKGLSGPTMNIVVDPPSQAIFFNSTTNTVTYKIKQTNGSDGFLSENAMYSVTLSTGIKTRSGASLASDYSWKFTTDASFGVYSGAFGF